MADIFHDGGHSDLTETRLSGEAVYDGVLLHVRRDLVRLPNAKEAVREYVVHPGAVTIIPILDSGDLLMERQHRYPLGRDLVELPAGKIDPGESTLETAQRELREETGYVAADWRFVTTMHPLCAYSTERIELWLARRLVHQGRALDDAELLATLPVPLATALDWVREGRVSDAKTIIGVLWAEKILSGAWPEPSARSGPLGGR